MSNKTKKQLLLNLPYFIAGLVCTNLGEAWRIAEGADMSEKLLGFLSALGAAFSNPMPSLHPMDLLIGVCCGAGLRLAVYLKGKNAKKYRHGMEYGSARWGTSVRTASCGRLTFLRQPPAGSKAWWSFAPLCRN